jgi:two-component system, OmpR family, alkaline phosphatase synthesis response regulator PhoP
MRSELSVSHSSNQSTGSKSVLLLEDDPDIASLLRIHLEDAGFDLVHCTKGEDGLHLLDQREFELIVLDLGLPGMDGMAICKAIRARGFEIPILILTARTEEAEKVKGLETGADDYMTKPFGVKEFMARVKALVRRASRDSGVAREKAILFKGLEIDRIRRKVIIQGEKVELTPKEFDLLTLLASNPGVTYSRKDLLSKVWGYEYEGYEHTVNSHINRLRAKIEKDPDHPFFVLTTWGVGYRFNDELSSQTID